MYAVAAGLGWFVLIRSDYNFPFVAWLMILSATGGLVCHLVVRVLNRRWPARR